jgi:pimeloyl-ACP methyl ester carboxylesterase
VIPIVLVHGGGLDSRCWERLSPELAAPSLAIDLPGRGAHPADPRSVTFAACAETVRDDIDAAGFDDLVLVGHSLAGCSMPMIIDTLGARVRHAVFVAATVPDDGKSAYDMLDPEIQEWIRNTGDAEPRAMDPEMAKVVFGSDLTAEQFAFCAERLVAEAPRLTTDAVDLSPLRSAGCGRTWVRTLQDGIVPPEQQLRYADNVGDCRVVDFDAGHMCMVSRPGDLARILDEIAGA